MPRVLIQCGDHLDNQTRILPLAQALRGKGWTPVVMVYAHATGNLFLEHGIDVISLDEYRPATAIRKCVHWLLSRRLGPGDTYQGINIAECVYVDRLTSPWHYKGKTKGEIFRPLFRNADALLKVIERVQPECIVIWNGYTGYVANILRAYCKTHKVPHAFIERGPVEPSLFIDNSGVNGFSELADITEDKLQGGLAGESSWETIQQVFVPEYTPDPDFEHEIQTRYRLGDKKIIFIPLQVESDTNIALHSDRILTMRDLCLLVLDATEQMDDVHIVARPHPEELPSHDLHLPVDKKLTVTTIGGIEDWIRRSDLTVTINSTVGYEAALRGKAVIAMGKGLYTGKGFTLTPDVKGMAEAIRQCLTMTEQDMELTQGSMKRYTVHLAADYLLFSQELLLSQSNPRVIEKVFGTPPTKGGAHDLERFNSLGIDVRQYSEMAQTIKSRFWETVNDAGKLNVLLQLNKDDFLDLTYRKNEEVPAISHYQDLLSSYVSGFCSRPIDIHVSEHRHDKSNNVPMMVVVGEGARNFNIRGFGDKNFLVVDQYLNVHPFYSRK